MNRLKLREKFVPSVCLIIIGVMLASNFVASASDTRQDFVLSNETEVLLNEVDADVYYNGSILITVTSGDPINATVNGVTLEISLGETKELFILNTTSIYFSLSTYGYSVGYFEMELNYNPTGSNNPIRRTIGIAAAFIIAISVIAYYIRAKKLERKPDEEDKELIDPETMRKRREASGAEKKFWGLDDIDQKKE